MPDIKLQRVGNEFRSIRAAKAVAVRAVEVLEKKKEHLLLVGEQVLEAGERVVEKLEPYLPEDPRRRTVLKYSLIGGAAFMLAKVLGPQIGLFEKEEVKEQVQPVAAATDKEYQFQNFRVVEKDGKLGFYDKSGKEILVLDNDTETQG